MFFLFPLALVLICNKAQSIALSNYTVQKLHSYFIKNHLFQAHYSTYNHNVYAVSIEYLALALALQN